MINRAVSALPSPSSSAIAWPERGAGYRPLVSAFFHDGGPARLDSAGLRSSVYNELVRFCVGADRPQPPPHSDPCCSARAAVAAGAALVLHQELESSAASSEQHVEAKSAKMEQ